MNYYYRLSPTDKFISIAFLLLMTSVSAQSEVEISRQDSIMVTGVKNPAFYPYKDALRYLLAYKDCPLLIPKFQITKTKGVEIEKLKISLQSEGVFKPLEIDARAWTVDIPVLPELASSNAELVANVKEGYLVVKVITDLKIRQNNNLRLIDFKDTIDQLNRCERSVYPAYIRLISSKYSAIQIRFKTQSATITLTEPTNQILSANSDNYILIDESVWNGKIYSSVIFSTKPIEMRPVIHKEGKRLE